MKFIYHSGEYVLSANGHFDKDNFNTYHFKEVFMALSYNDFRVLRRRADYNWQKDSYKPIPYPLFSFVKDFTG